MWVDSTTQTAILNNYPEVGAKGDFYPPLDCAVSLTMFHQLALAESGSVPVSIFILAAVPVICTILANLLFLLSKR